MFGHDAPYFHFSRIDVRLLFFARRVSDAFTKGWVVPMHPRGCCTSPLQMFLPCCYDRVSALSVRFFSDLFFYMSALPVHCSSSHFFPPKNAEMAAICARACHTYIFLIHVVFVFFFRRRRVCSSSSTSTQIGAAHGEIQQHILYVCKIISWQFHHHRCHRQFNNHLRKNFRGTFHSVEVSGQGEKRTFCR